MRATGWSAGLVLALGWCAPAFAGSPVQGSFRVGVRVLAPPGVATTLLDAVPAPAGARRLTRNVAGNSYRIDRDADVASGLWHDAMIAGGYRLVWRSGDGRASTWAHARHRVDVDVREVIGTHTARVVVQATPTS